MWSASNRFEWSIHSVENSEYELLIARESVRWKGVSDDCGEVFFILDGVGAFRISDENRNI